MLLNLVEPFKRTDFRDQEHPFTLDQEVQEEDDDKRYAFDAGAHHGNDTIQIKTLSSKCENSK